MGAITLRVKKAETVSTKLIIHGSWQYRMKVLWSETIYLSKKVDIIYTINTCNP